VVVPLAARIIAAIAGGLLVLASARSMIGTIIVPRPASGWLTRSVEWLVNSFFRLITAGSASYKRIDRTLAGQASVILLAQLLAWLLMFWLGYTLLVWPFLRTGITTAFTTAGPGLWGIGAADVHGAGERAIQDISSLTGIITVTLQIAYLPTLYSAFNRRETDVALLNARGGVPSWGPELLARTHYALGSGSSTIDTLPDLYEQWERFAADIAESHTTYLPLIRFRSPRPLSSWVVSLLAVIDSAALYLALCPESVPEVAARLCLRSGFSCFEEIARALRLSLPDVPDPEAGIALTYEEFLDAVNRMREVDFPIEREPEQAWPEFIGWRVNYEQAAYAIAEAVDAVPALWSGPRRRPFPAIAPIRPAAGRAPKQHPDSRIRRNHFPRRPGSGN
jgi:hypothetical protein